MLGCGDPLVGSDYVGAPLLELEGAIEFASIDEIKNAEGQLRIALMWQSPDGEHVAGESVSDIADQTIAITGLPGHYHVRKYVPPPASVVHSVAGVDGDLALGLLVVYVDEDDDEGWSPGIDWLVGASATDLVVWAEDPVSAAGVELEPGYHVVHVRRDPESSLTACGDPIPGFTSLVGSESADGASPVLVIALLHDVLVDRECDNEAREYDVCPPPAHIAALCAEPQEPALERCLPWVHCG